MNIFLKQAFYIILLSFLLSFLRYFFIEQDYPLIKPISKAIIETYSADTSIDSLKDYLNNISEPKIINIDLAQKIHKYQLATFIDARDYDSYKEKHIEGAINITFEMLEQFADEIDVEFMIEVEGGYVGYLYENDQDKHVLLQVGQKDGVSFIIPLNEKSNLENVIEDKNSVFIVYCSGEGCSLSEELAFYMLDRFNIKKTLIYEGGIPEWINNNLPVE